MATEKQLIFVLGMHRSGTSAVTRLLNLLGAELGNNLLAAQTGVNEKGFWEHKELVNINEKVLTELDSAWFDFSKYQPEWWQQSYFEVYKKQIQSFIDATFPLTELAALKDPRLCRLLPLWQNALQFSGKKLKAILVLRHPDEVVTSISLRDPFTRETGFLLWATYVRESEFASRIMPRSIIQYQSILEDWQSCAKKIASDLDTRWLGLDDASIQRINGEINPKLRHNTARQRSEKSSIERICMDAWNSLTSKDVDIEQLDAIWKELDTLLDHCTLVSHTVFSTNKKLLESSSELSRQIAERDDTIQDNLKKLESLGSEHQYALNTIAERDEQFHTLGLNHEHALNIIQERDEQLHTLGLNHEHALSIVQERDEQLALRNQQLDKLLSNRLIRTLNKMLKLTDTK